MLIDNILNLVIGGVLLLMAILFWIWVRRQQHGT